MTYRENNTITHNGKRYFFAWRSSYFGCVEYEIIVEGESYRAKLRNRLSDYERGILNYSADKIRTHVESAIGLLVRSDGRDAGEIDADTIAAFNAWRAREHAAMLEYMIAHPERYGDAESLRAEYPAPPAVAAGRFDNLTGWSRIEPIPAAA